MTYVCYFDTIVDSVVTTDNLCTNLPGVSSFNSSTGLLDWTPSYDANDSLNTIPKYEFRIRGSANGKFDDEVFVINVNNVNRPPSIVPIANQAVSENVAISQVDADDSSGGDTDIDGDALVYSCYFDNLDDESVANTNLCTSLPGTVSFDTATGIFNWNPNNDAVTTGQGILDYEIKIQGTSNSQTAEEFFVITITNVDRPPVLSEISNETVNEVQAITQVDAGDTTNGDEDRDNDTVTGYDILVIMIQMLTRRLERQMIVPLSLEQQALMLQPES